MNTTHRFYFRALGATLAGLCLATAAAQKPIDEQATMRADGRVTVVNVAGDVKIRGWDRAELRLTGRLSENVERLDFDANGTDVSIEVVYKKRHKRDHGWDWGRDDSNTFLDIKLPSDADLDVNTVSANIDIDGHRGPQRIESVSGEIELTLSEREADVQSVSGNIDARGGQAQIEAQLSSVSGDVKVRGFNGDIEVETVSGDMDIRDVQARDAEFESVSGDIDLTITLASNGRLEMETVSGDIGLAFIGGTRGRFRIDSHSGDIDSFCGLRAERTKRYGPGYRLRGECGGGGADVSISTLSGDVRNRSRD